MMAPLADVLFDKGTEVYSIVHTHTRPTYPRCDCVDKLYLEIKRIHFIHNFGSLDRTNFTRLTQSLVPTLSNSTHHVVHAH
jgi:GDP-D-mannose dehydratase